MDEVQHIDFLRGLYTAMMLPPVAIILIVKAVLFKSGIEVTFLELWMIVVGVVTVASMLFFWYHRGELEEHIRSCVGENRCPIGESSLHRVRERITFWCIERFGVAGKVVAIAGTAFYIGLFFPVLFLLRDITGKVYL